MPTYEYLCTACGHDLEVVQSFSDDPLVTCPECGGTLRKVFGSVGIVLKGSGFYKTDNRRSGKSGAPADPAKSAGSNGSESNGSGSNGSTSEKSASSGTSESSGKSESKGSAPVSSGASPASS